MSRFLFVVPPLADHLSSTIAVGTELASRNHEVAWVAHASMVGQFLSPRSTLFPTDHAVARNLQTVARRFDGLQDRCLWNDVLIPFAEATLPHVEAAVDRFAPHALVVEQEAIAGALVARRRRLNWATSTTLGEPPGLWLSEKLRGFQIRAGIPAPDHGDLCFSEQLVLAFNAPALASGGPVTAEWLFVGPPVARRDPLTTFPPSWLDPALKHVLITLEARKAPAGAPLFSAAVAAAARLPNRLQAIVAAPDDMLEFTPPNILIRSGVSPVDLLPHVDAVVSDAGHEAVCATLAHGVPLVLAPMRGDQGIIADRVMNAGAGVQVKAGRVDADHIADALLTVLDERSYRCAAQRLQASFRAAGGASAAADGLQRLAGARQSVVA